MQFCPLVSGSSGNAAYVEAGGMGVLVDAGVSARRICGLLDAVGVEPGSIGAILVTHEHSDHISGINVFSKKYDVPVYANQACWAQMGWQLRDVAPRNVRVFEPDREFYLKGLNVLPFSTPHDSAHPVGYRFLSQGVRAVVMTDIGHVTGHMLDVAGEADILLIEANHDVDMLKAGSYPYSLKQRILSQTGHLSNENAGLALVKLFGKGVRNAILGHLSRENNTPELALATVRSVLEENGMLDAMHIAVAGREAPNGLYEIA